MHVSLLAVVNVISRLLFGGIGFQRISLFVRASIQAVLYVQSRRLGSMKTSYLRNLETNFNVTCPGIEVVTVSGFRVSAGGSFVVCLFAAPVWS